MADADAPTEMQKLAAEAIGTFVLVLFGVGAVLASGGGDYAAVGLSFGIAIVAMVYAFGRISGGHFNPAVSVGAALGGRISWRDAGLYSAAQVVGATVGGAILALIQITGDTGYEFGDPLGANGFGDQGGVELVGALLIEIVMTFVFVLIILSVTDTRNEHPALAPLAIGLALAAIHFASMGATGTSVNPARSIGVVFFSGGDAMAQIWLFILAPLIGAALAGFTYPALFGHGAEPVPGSGLNFGAPATVAAGGYVDQYQQQWNQPVAEAAPPAEQPIIQDGWQWDPQAQQWIPAQQQAAPPPQQAAPPAQQQGWPAPDQGSDPTQMKPPGQP